MVWKPHVTVAAVARDNDRFLVVKERVEGSIVINQPAGHLEPGESFVDAVQREVLEETAWAFEPRFLVGVYLLPRPESEITYLRFCFGGECTTFCAERSLDKDIIEALWMTRQELFDKENQMRSPLVLKCVDDLLAGHAYSLQLLSCWPTTVNSGKGVRS